jgi:hypothetical protein
MFADLRGCTYPAIAFLGTALCIIYRGYFLGHRSHRFSL